MKLGYLQAQFLNVGISLSNLSFPFILHGLKELVSLVLDFLTLVASLIFNVLLILVSMVL